MQDYSSNNKRLAKNTVFMTLRMLILMVISLYTSRVTLDVLGVDDFGIYNIVGGVVVLFSFISTSLNNACNRYFSLALVDNNPDSFQKSFSTALFAHLLLTFAILIILETAGLWFITNKVNIPTERVEISKVVFQFAVFSVCINTLRVPFNASILCHEKMDFYASVGLIEGVLKLLIAFCIIRIPLDKLMSYSILMACSVFLIFLAVATLCVKKFEGDRIVLKTDKKSLKEMLSFSGWNLIGGIADVGWQQGVNIILNLFFGVVYNAVFGIINQIRNAVFAFVDSLQSAANPQIIKSSANENNSHMQSLVFSVSKLSFYSMLLISLPLISGMDFVLNLWLVDVPQGCASFTIGMLMFCVASSLCGPLWVVVQASGKIKLYYVVVSLIYLLNVPVTYILFRFGFPAISTMFVRFFLQILAVIWTFLCAKRLAGLCSKHYFTEVLIPVFGVSLITAVLLFLIVFIIDIESVRFFIALFLGDSLLALSIYFWGINKHEREICVGFIQSLKKKWRLLKRE